MPHSYSGGNPLSSAQPNLIQESLLCNHPHAMAKIPTEQTYSEPLINQAAIMLFLLPENIYDPYSPDVMS